MMAGVWVVCLEILRELSSEEVKEFEGFDD